MPANFLATRLDVAERADSTEPASTHIASAADALEPSSQPSSIATRVYGYRIKFRFLLITPAAIGPQYFRESAEVINARPDGPPDRAKMAEIMHRHGLTPAPPPAQA